MEISQFDETQTKAAVYDQLAYIEQCNNIIKALNEHLMKLIAAKLPPEKIESNEVIDVVSVPVISQEEVGTEPDEQPISEVPKK